MFRRLIATAALTLVLAPAGAVAEPLPIPPRPDDVVTITDYPPVLVECDVIETTVTVTVVGHEWDGTAWVRVAPVETTTTGRTEVSESEVLAMGLPFECSDDEPTPEPEPVEPQPQPEPAAPAAAVRAAPTFTG